MTTDRQPQSTRELLVGCLRAAGARRVFGDVPLEGLAHVPVADDVTARSLADADGRLGPGAGAALSGRALRVSSLVGAAHDPVTIDSPAELPTAIAQWAAVRPYGAVDLQLDLDLDGPAPDDAEPLVLQSRPERTLTLSEELAGLGVLVLAGPGVLRAGAVESLATMAGRGGFGVVNTWGAKGVFTWDSPHHFGTAGLQARDFELAGLADAAAVVGVGLDPLEARPSLLATTQLLEVEPEHLEALTVTWAGDHEVPPLPALYRELSAVVGPMYEVADVPINPARAAAALAATRRPGGLVAADPGPAGLWVARTFPTTDPASVVVPATVGPGFAASAALVAALDGRSAVAVTTSPVDEQTEVTAELARSLGLPLVVEVWGDGDASAADAQLDRTSAALAAGGVALEHYPVDFSATRALVEVAGEVVAWTDR